MRSLVLCRFLFRKKKSLTFGVENIPDIDRMDRILIRMVIKYCIYRVNQCVLLYALEDLSICEKISGSFSVLYIYYIDLLYISFIMNKVLCALVRLVSHDYIYHQHQTLRNTTNENLSDLIQTYRWLITTILSNWLIMLLFYFEKIFWFLGWI